ncbi:MAG: hypothetical protein ACI9TK_000029 [Flavobacteriaceae bacterium]|jgi:hypothetical protein|tara:strand:- start:6722 stop:6976 length:255 start_codon:yes stop_codon:yes gene_type:complete
MQRVIRSLKKCDSALQNSIYLAFKEGELETTTFPYLGELVKGVLYETDGLILLIPLNTIAEYNKNHVDISEKIDEELSEIDFEE